MDIERFRELVARAVEELPDEFTSKLENVEVVVQDYPTSAQLRKSRVRRNETLLGLYEGVPLTKRDTHYGLVPPDKITVFQKPIESICKTEAEIVAEVQKVVKHEVAHFFGIGEKRLREIEG